MVKAPVPAEVSEEQASEIVVDKFTVVSKQLSYDEQAYGVWLRKCSNAVYARIHAEQGFLIERREKCLNAAQHFVENYI